MLTLPSTVEKATPLSFTLNKSAVLAAAADSYWQTSANIKSVIVVYRSTAGNQRKRLEFDFTQATPTTTATWTGTARSDHDIEQIVLVDFDGDTYSIPSANLPSGKGVSFGGGAPIVTPTVNNFQPNGAVTEMVTDGSAVWIAGAFTALRYSTPFAATVSPDTAETLMKDQLNGNFPIFNGLIRTIAFDGADTMWVGGDFTTMNGLARRNVAKLNRVSGAWVSDATFNLTGKNCPSTSSAGTSEVHRIVVDTDGVFILGAFPGWVGPNGSTSTTSSTVKVSKTDGTKLAFNCPCYASNGTALNGWTYAGLIVGEYIYLGGSDYYAANGSRRVVKANKTTGAVDTTWATFGNTGGTMSVYDIVKDGEYFYILGFINSSLQVSGATVSSQNMIRVKVSDGTRDLAFVSPFSASSSTTNYLLSGAIDGSGNIIVGGVFNNTVGKNIAKISSTGTVVSEFAPGNTCLRAASSSSVRSVLVSGGYVYAFGQFTGQGASGDPVTVINAVKMSVSTGAVVSAFATSTRFGDSSSEAIYTAAVDGSKLVMVGNFTGWDGIARAGLAKIAKDSDGNWKVATAFDPGLGGSGINSMQISGNDLYIGGTFTTWAGSTRNRVAKINATTGALDGTFGVGVFTSGQTTGQFDGVTNTVNQIVLDGNDLHIVGAFSTVQIKSSASSTTTTSTKYWVRVNVLTNTQTTYTVTTGTSTLINSMCLDATNAWLFGDLINWGGFSQRRIFKVNKLTGAVDTAFVCGLFYASPNTMSRIQLIDDKVWCFGSWANNSGYDQTCGIVTLNKDTGAQSFSHTASQWGASAVRLSYVRVMTDASYIYIIGSNGSSTSATSGSYIRRLNRTTFALDTAWGLSVYSAAGNDFIASAMVGSEFVIGGKVQLAAGNPSLIPMSKSLYSIKATDAAQNTNI